MFKSYIKSAYRSILANKLFSAIHIVGLSIGLAACFIMLMIVIHEYSYDKHNEKLDRIYRAYSYSPASGKNWQGVPYPLSEYISENIPEVERSAKVQSIRVNVSNPDNEEVFKSKQAYCIEPDLIDILTIPSVQGNLKHVIANPKSILISENIAEQYFPGKDPIGKNLLVKTRRPAEEDLFTIAGIFKDFPYTSTFKTDYLLPIQFNDKLILDRYSFRKDFSLDSWSFIHGLVVYVLANPETDISKVEGLLPRHIDFEPNSNSDFEYKFHPYSDIHLNSKFVNFIDYYISGSKLKLFTGIAILILLIACFNFIVMSISRIKQKAKNVGIRKVIGAAKKNVASIVLIESIIYSLLSLPLTLGLIELFYKKVASSLNINLAEGYNFNYWILLLFLLLTVLIGIVAGLYSTLKLTKLTPLQTITYRKSVNEKNVKSTPVFISTQMVVFIAMIFCAIIIKQQTAYFKKIDLGFNPENILTLYLNDHVENSYEAFKEELKKSPLIKGVGGAGMIPPTLSFASGNVPRKDDPNTLIELKALWGDYEFPDVMGFQLIKGRNLDITKNADSTEAYIFNEAAMKAINVELGDIVNNRRVVGVIKDFQYGSIREDVPPIAYYIGKLKYIDELAIRFQSARDVETIKWIEHVWKEFVPNQPMTYFFMDDKFDDVYRREYNFAGLINASAGLAVFIACLGLFGFTVFSTEQRIKEIGIRRVLGASLADILRLFFSQFILLILVSSVIGIALGDYFISQWLNGFAYKIDILPSYYIIAGVISAVIILTTISIYIIKTVSSNPVEALKYE